ncbi:MAG: NFACT family protein [Thermomicrobiales bacterium]|nr:NFACT family protein [Thermomicrobiales bacterium]
MFDLLTIAAMTDELSATLLDGRIQKIGLADPRTLSLEVYSGGRRHALIASADDRSPRILLTGQNATLDASLTTPFVLLLRKYARGGVIVGIEQPPLERIIKVSIAKRLAGSGDRPEESDTEIADDADDDEAIYGVESPTFVHLYIEIMGRHSNLILVNDDGLIMESVKRVTPSMSRVRPIQPRRPYTVPPPIDRPDPRRITADRLQEMLASGERRGDLAGWLVRSFRALSPQMAREIAFLGTGAADARLETLPSGAALELSRAMRTLLEPLATSQWSPVWYRDDEEAPVAFTPVPMQHLAFEYTAVPTPSISEAARQVVTGGDTPGGRHDARKRRLLDEIGALRERVTSRLKSLSDEQDRAAANEHYREWGETIYAWLWQIQPGDTELVVEEARIPLDPGKSPSENAQDYFEKYRRGRDAGTHLPELIAKNQAELTYLDQLTLHIEQASTFPEIESLMFEWEQHRNSVNPGGRPQTKLKRSAPPRRLRPLLDRHGNAIYIGKSGNENDEVTFSLAGPNDSWLHARGVPGSHVVIRWRNQGDEAPETIEVAAKLAAWYSRNRNSGSVEVDIAPRRYVRKIKGAGPGMVTYRNERTIAVNPASEETLDTVLS